MTLRPLLLMVEVLLVLALLVAPVLACDTPVYRYAMYRWQPAPYEVYFFHAGDEAREALAPVEAAIEAVYNDAVASANIALFPIDVAADKELKTVPPDVRRTWQAKSDATVPQYMVVNPMGGEVFTGDLTAEDIAEMIDSPLRQQVGRLLGDGNAGVYLLVPGTDAALNQAAEKAVMKLVADVKTGKLDLYAGPEPLDFGPTGLPASQETEPHDPPDESSTEEQAGEEREEPGDTPDDEEQTNGVGEEPDGEDSDKAEAAPPHSVAALTLTREMIGDQEQWLYRTLMAVEDDLGEFQDEPMLFVIFGRGRALPPYIGKGITYQNLVEVTEFVTGACSCTVAEQNPGVDLLTHYDWEAASAKVADRFGVEEGNEARLSDLFPQLTVQDGGETQITAADDSEPADEQPTEEKPQDEPQPAPIEAEDGATAVAPVEVSDGEDSSASTIGSAADDAEPATDETATSAEAEETEEAVAAALPGRQASDTPSSAASLLTTLGIGIAVGFVVLVAATFLILKPQS